MSTEVLNEIHFNLVPYGNNSRHITSIQFDMSLSTKYINGCTFVLPISKSHVFSNSWAKFIGKLPQIFN